MTRVEVHDAAPGTADVNPIGQTVAVDVGEILTVGVGTEIGETAPGGGSVEAALTVVEVHDAASGTAGVDPIGQTVAVDVDKLLAAGVITEVTEGVARSGSTKTCCGIKSTTSIIQMDNRAAISANMNPI